MTEEHDEKDDFSPEYIRTLEEALRIDYLEKGV